MLTAKSRAIRLDGFRLSALWLEIANHKAKAAQQNLYALESEIHQTEAAMKERLELRDHERAEFKKSLKLDAAEHPA